MGRGRPGLHLVHGFVNRPRDVRDAHNPLAPLCDRPDDVQLVIDLVESSLILAQVVALDLPSDEEDWGGTGIRSPQRGRGILNSGPRYDQPHSRLSFDPGVSIGHVDCALFMPYGEESNLWLPKEGIEDMHDLDAGNPEDNLDAFPLQRFYDSFPSGHSLHGQPQK